MELAINPHFASAKPALVVGMMSGTSMDGIDVCAVKLSLGDKGWSYEILAANTFPYPQQWIDSLNAAYYLKENELADLDLEYGNYLGSIVHSFCESFNLNPQLVASHGHTIHHRPAEGYTRQIGNPSKLAKAAQLDTVADFRSLDVELGGQGAPLVPIVDRLLFGEYAQCLNLGGFANVSFEQADKRIAFDITVANALLNKLALLRGLPFDEDGQLASKGRVLPELLAALETMAFYEANGPKSLGREWLEQDVWPLFLKQQGSLEDLMATAVHHIAQQLATSILAGPAGKVLVTGGGAYNTFLIDSLRQNLLSTHQLVLPKGQLIDYKEALAFALLGTLRIRGETNCLASVTGASRNSSGGIFCSYNAAC